MKAIISKETLWHFQCTACEQWWTIGDYKGGSVIYCPRCHQKLEVDESKAEEPFTTWMKGALREHSLQGTCPPPTVKSPDTIRDEALEEAAAHIEKERPLLYWVAEMVRSMKTQP